jgi:Icc-related predicted phosphoesterase
VPTTERPERADVLFTADLHGSGPLYQETFDLAKRLDARALLLGGDLAPHGDVATQRRFFREQFLPAIRSFLAERPSTQVYFIFGNDDWRASLAEVEGAAMERLHYIHARAVPFLDGAWITGLASVPMTPFGMKDWDRWEDGPSPASRPEGMRSAPDGTLRPFTLAGREEEDSMAADLKAIERELPLGETPLVCLFHGPPYGTALDQIAAGIHVGSRETRRFLERRQPLLGLHGHIHESPAVSGRFADRVGVTICVNAGQRRDGPLHAVWFRLDDPGASLTHSILGRAGV